MIKDYIKSLKLPYRGNCPECLGDNCFIASVVNGVIKYYCFRASCGIKGVMDYEVSIDELRNNFIGLSNSFGAFNSKACNGLWGSKGILSYTIPEYFISPLQNRICYSYLDRYNLIDFYSKHVDRIKYDPKEHRCVFILKDHEGVIKGATGRTLSFDIEPKWLVYDRSNGCPYICRSMGQEFILLVEDCISASVLNSIGSSMAILGTTLSDAVIPYLLEYSKIYILLDDDATGKSLQIQKQLSAYRKTFIIPTKIDPKYYNQNQLNELKEIIKNV